jgi:hypothetical protein
LPQSDEVGAGDRNGENGWRAAAFALGIARALTARPGTTAVSESVRLDGPLPDVKLVSNADRSEERCYLNDRRDNLTLQTDRKGQWPAR